MTFNEWLMKAGMVYGGLTDDKIVYELHRIGITETQVESLLNLFRAIHAATYKGNKE